MAWLPSRRVRSVGFWVLAAVLVAALSCALLPSLPSYDPYSWIIWGREVSDPHLRFAVFDGPSWKPLPFAFTVLYGLFGGAAPTLWMITARAAGLLGLLVAGRLAARLSGGGRWGAVAGTLAAAGIVLTYDWPYDMLRGTSEPGLVALALWSVDALVGGRRRTAFWALVGVALLRPESWPLLLALALWLGVADPEFASGSGRRLELGAGLALVPLGWFVPPWLGSGAPLLAARNAASYDGVLGSDPLWTELGRLVGEQTWPLLVAALAFVVVRILAGPGRRAVAGLAGGVLVWWAIVVVMALAFGYPGLERFFLPAAAVVCVLGGAGIVALARAAGSARPAAAVGALLVLVAAAGVGSLRPLRALPVYEPEAALAVRTVDGMDRAVAAVGGRAALLRCATSFVAVNHAAQPALAWELRVGLPRVGTAMSRPGVDLIGPANRATGVPAAIDPRLTRSVTLAHVGRWWALRLRDPRRPGWGSCR